jgi:hypothetical protein
MGGGVAKWATSAGGGISSIEEAASESGLAAGSINGGEKLMASYVNNRRESIGRGG